MKKSLFKALVVLACTPMVIFTVCAYITNVAYAFTGTYWDPIGMTRDRVMVAFGLAYFPAVIAIGWASTTKWDKIK